MRRLPWFLNGKSVSALSHGATAPKKERERPLTFRIKEFFPKEGNEGPKGARGSASLLRIPGRLKPANLA